MHRDQTCSTAASGCLQPASHLRPFCKQTVHTSAYSAHFCRASMRRQVHDAAFLLKTCITCFHRKLCLSHASSAYK